MEKIKIHDTEYDIISIMPAARNVLRIEFAGVVPEERGISHDKWWDGGWIHQRI